VGIACRCTAVQAGRRFRERMEKMKYRVHRFDIKMTSDQSKLEQFLNNLEGEIVAIIPNVNMGAFWVHRVDFVLIVEKLS
jgi:short-subunit dehydrogenase